MKNSFSYIHVAYAIATLMMIIVMVKIVPQDSKNMALAFQSIYGIISAPVEYRENSPMYKFTNPILFTESDQNFFHEYDDYDATMNAYVRKMQNTHKADAISVYLRDVNNGHWTGTNLEEKYEPSSMLKVAVMISYLRKALTSASQSTSSIDIELSKKVYYPGPDESEQYYKASEHLDPGDYSIRDLLNDMIVNSDNVAMRLLVTDNLDEFMNVYNDFRLLKPAGDGTTDYMTVRSFSVVFRTLYNSTYLPWDVSEQALKLLSETHFQSGLTAGVSSSTIIAHKFGEHTNILSNGDIINHELHDCGIIYYPSHPYFLCVMTKGQSFPDLDNVISTISRMTYDYVDKHSTQTSIN